VSPMRQVFVCSLCGNEIDKAGGIALAKAILATPSITLVKYVKGVTH